MDKRLFPIEIAAKKVKDYIDLLIAELAHQGGVPSELEIYYDMKDGK